MGIFIREEILIFILDLFTKVLGWYWFFPVWSKHGECFTWSCLSICKYCAIKAWNNPEDWVSTHVINILLRSILGNNFVISTFNQMNSIWNFNDLGLWLIWLTPFSARTTSSWLNSHFNIGLIQIATLIQVSEPVKSVEIC